MSEFLATAVAPDPLSPRARVAVDSIHKLAYSVDEALALVPVGRTTLYSLMESGELRSLKIRGRRVIPRDALLELIGGGGDV